MKKKNKSLEERIEELEKKVKELDKVPVPIQPYYPPMIPNPKFGNPWYPDGYWWHPQIFC